MYCKYCGSKVEENSKFCPNCGHEINEINQENHSSTTTDVETQEDKYALIGFALGLSALLSMAILAIPGIIFSLKGKESEKRKTLANVGLGCSIASICLTIFFIIVYALLFKTIIESW